MKENKDDDRALQAGISALESIVEMIERLQHCDVCDGESFEECEFDRDTILSGVNIYFQQEINADEFERYFEQYHDRDDAEESIRQDPLSVEVRGDWHTPGDPDASNVEYRILLGWGGPAVQIKGELDEYNEPESAWIEYQDWGTPWTRLWDTTTDQDDALLAYAQQFWFMD